jgi:hypothetical protein
VYKSNIILKEKILKMKEILVIKPSKKSLLDVSDEKDNPSNRMSIKTFNSNGIECSKLEENLLIGSEDSQASSHFWRQMAFKSRVALKNVDIEKRQLKDHIHQLNEENKSLRENKEILLILLDHANAVKVWTTFIFTILFNSF